jgi:excisionase family DNA binding protein
MLTVKQVATRLNVSPSTVRKLIDSGQLKAIRVGIQLRVTEEALAEYIRGASM